MISNSNSVIVQLVILTCDVWYINLKLRRTFSPLVKTSHQRTSSYHLLPTYTPYPILPTDRRSNGYVRACLNLHIYTLALCRDIELSGATPAAGAPAADIPVSGL